MFEQRSIVYIFCTLFILFSCGQNSQIIRHTPNHITSIGKGESIYEATKNAIEGAERVFPNYTKLKAEFRPLNTSKGWEYFLDVVRVPSALAWLPFFRVASGLSIDLYGDAVSTNIDITLPWELSTEDSGGSLFDPQILATTNKLSIPVSGCFGGLVLFDKIYPLLCLSLSLGVADRHREYSSWDIGLSYKPVEANYYLDFLFHNIFTASKNYLGGIWKDLDESDSPSSVSVSHQKSTAVSFAFGQEWFLSSSHTAGYQLRYIHVSHNIFTRFNNNTGFNNNISRNSFQLLLTSSWF